MHSDTLRSWQGSQHEASSPHPGKDVSSSTVRAVETIAERLDISTSHVAGGCTKKGQYNYQPCFCFLVSVVVLLSFFIRAFIWVLCLREKRKEKKDTRLE